jgi:UrcA family protein
MMSARSTVLFAAAIVAGFVNIGCAGSAVAQPQETIAVSYADLNLANAAGRDILDRRIGVAAVQLCGDYNPLELGRADAGRDCVSATLAAVQPQRDAAIGARFGTVRVSHNDFTLRVSRAAS